MADENATVEKATEEVTLPSEETKVENTEAQTAEESTEESDKPSEGDNTSEESTEDAVEKLSPRYERDNKRLNQLLETRNKEIEAIKTASVTTPQFPTRPIPPTNSYAVDQLSQQVQALSAQLNQKAETEFWEQDQDSFDKVLSEYPELKKNTRLLEMIKNDARSRAQDGGLADYVKTARSINKELGFAEARGQERAEHREQIVGQGSQPLSKKGSTVETTDFDRAKKAYIKKERRTTGDIADLIGAVRKQ